jgi:hypothetical protein
VCIELLVLVYLSRNDLRRNIFDGRASYDFRPYSPGLIVRSLDTYVDRTGRA